MTTTTTIAPTAPAGTPEPGRAARRRRWRGGGGGQTAVVGLAVVVVGYLTLVPLGYLLHDTFTGRSGLSFAAFSRAYAPSQQAGTMLVNSCIFALGSTVLALVLGTTVAYIYVRTDAPFKSLIFIASLVPLIIPGILYTAAWVFLADPRIGVLNTMILTPLTGAPRFDIFSMSGMIWVQGTHTAPVAFLLMAASFRGMDPSIEEAAMMTGARLTTVLRYITIPLLRPATISVALLLFVQALESFEVPALLGLPRNIYVFTNRIYFMLNQYPSDFGAAGAYAITLLMIAVAGIVAGGFAGRGERRFQTVTGKAFRPRPMPLGRSRPYLGVGVAVFFLVTVVLPIMVLSYASLLRYYSVPSKAALRGMTLANYRALVTDSTEFSALLNTIVVGLVSAAAVTLISAVVSWVIARSRSRARRLLDVGAFIPLVIPGMVLGLALGFVYLRLPIPIYGTLAILMVAYTTRFLPYGVRYASASLSQISAELEESAMVSGASWITTFTRILVPLASSGLVAGFVYVLIFSFRELSSTILLYSPGKEVVSVLLWEEYQNGEFTALAAAGVSLVVLLIALVALASKLGSRVGLESSGRR